MNKSLFATLTLASLAVSAMLVTPVHARSKRFCTNKPRTEWLSATTIISKAEALGYQIREVEVKGSCYKVEGHDKNGASIELLFNPETGEPKAYYD